MKKTSRAFTLIELLVVVAIIVVLVAILLPSLGRARDQAKAIMCQSNLRALATACHLYAQDHNNTWPHGSHVSNDPDATRYGWWSYLNGDSKNPGYMNKMTTRGKVSVTCPKFLDYGEIPPSLNWPSTYTGYLFNAYMNIRKVGSLDGSLSSIVFAWDDKQCFNGFLSTNTYTGYPTKDWWNGGSYFDFDFRHVGNTTHFGMVDGHVEVARYRNPSANMSKPSAVQYKEYVWQP